MRYYSSMKALEALQVLADLCASQRGMFTVAQAESLGVGKMTVSRLAAGGQVERMERGVYRVSATPYVRAEDVYAAWLALDPATPAFERPFDGTGFTVSLNTAAWLQGLGELKATPFAFSYPKRRQTRGSMRFLKRVLPDTDISIVEGMPVTSPCRTVLDLIDYKEDLSLVSSVLRDAVARGNCEGIQDEVNARAMSCGFAKGFDLYGYLRRR